MIFYGISPKLVKQLGVCEDEYYKLCLGRRVEVTSMKKNNPNTVLTYSLSSSKVEDNFMVKYYPCNYIYFDKDIIDDSDRFAAVSCTVDRNMFSVYIGKVEKYEIRQGILALSGELSANMLVERQRAVYGNTQIATTLQQRVRILSVGLLGESLYGLLLLPRDRGLAVAVDGSDELALSAKNLQLRTCYDWKKFYIEDWFEQCKVQVCDIGHETSIWDELGDKSVVPEANRTLLDILNN